MTAPPPPPSPFIPQRPGSGTAMSPELTLASSKTTRMETPPPAPKLPSPPPLTPSPASRRTGSEDSLQSEDGKGGLEAGLASSPPPPPTVMPCTSTASPTSSHASTPASPKFPASKLSASSPASSTCSKASSRTSVSESYVTDIGFPIVHDPEIRTSSAVSRANATRVYSSSDDDAVADHLAVLTCANMLASKQEPLSNSSRDFRPNGCKFVSDDDERSHSIQRDSDVDQAWDKDLVDDQLSLEELQLDADAITAAIEKAPIGFGTLARDTGTKRRPRPASTRPSSSLQSRQSGVGGSVDRDDGLSEKIATERTVGSAVSLCRDNIRRSQLLGRVNQAANELAKLQVMTASRAADAACDHHRTPEESRDTQRLRVELRRLLITLDHLTRLSLEQAFITRDALETHL